MATTKAPVTVKKGDTLSAIAAKAGMTTAQVAKLNPQIANVNVIKPGQVINLAPAKAASSTPKGGTTAGGTTGGAAAGGTGGSAASTGTKIGEIPPTQNVAAGTIIGYKPGPVPGSKIAILADGAGGQTDAAGFEIDPNYQPTVQQMTAVNTERTLAQDTFKNTFAIMFGGQEASQAYVNDLYSLTSSFYKTGSTVDEALNLALNQAQEQNLMPSFTKRFAGLFALKEKLQSGMAVQVPTISEFFATEAKMGDTLRAAGMGDLATQDFLGQVIGNGKSASEIADTISGAFKNYDTAPQSVKDMISATPGMDRVSVAKAMLLGAEGAAALQKKVDTAGVTVAAKQAGLSVDSGLAGQIADMGYGYQSSLAKMGAAGAALPGANILNQIYGARVGKTYGQTEALAEQFGAVSGVSAAQATAAKNALSQTALAEFSGSGGQLQSAYGVDRSAFANKPAGLI